VVRRSGKEEWYGGVVRREEGGELRRVGWVSYRVWLVL